MRRCKVLPSALFAAAMRPSITRRDLEQRIDRILEELAARHANLAVASGRQAVDEAAEPLETRGIVVLEQGPLPRARAQRPKLLRARRSNTCWSSPPTTRGLKHASYNAR
ncbi:MAG: hypothetical protein QM736_23515 [Vicinamibacterales bacterium]